MICVSLCFLLSFVSYISAQEIETVDSLHSCEVIRVYHLHSIRLDCNGISNQGNQWKFEEKLLFLERFVVKQPFPEKADLYHNYSLFLTSLTLDHDGYYECTRNGTIRNSYCLIVEVYPVITIEINGRNYTDDTKVMVNGDVIAVCYAVGAKPAANLTWLVNTKAANPNKVTMFVHESERRKTFDTVAVLAVPVNDPRMNVTCISNSNKPAVENIKERITIALDVPLHEETKNNVTRKVVLSITIPLTILSVTVWCICRALRQGRDSTNCKERQDGICKRSDVPSLVCSTSLNNQTEPSNVTGDEEVIFYVSSDMVLYVEEQGTVTDEDPKKRHLDVEKFALTEGYTSNVKNNSFKVATYTDDDSSVHKTQTCSKKRLISKNHVLFVMDIKMGEIYKRWTGTINIPTENQKCVIISTATESALKRRVVSWSGFVKKIIELPYSEFVVKTEGICIDKDHLYLINEHLTCTPLDEYLEEKKLDAGSNVPFPAQRVLRYIIQILQGIEFLHTSGFLHPGLSPKKILVSNEDICKFYDFCLPKDATRIAILKKSQIHCTLNDFAPESLLRNEYTYESDVWLAAVVIWYLVSSGKFIFTSLCSVTTYSEAVLTNATKWPVEYEELRNELLVQCWAPDMANRPKAHQLQRSFNEILINFQKVANVDHADSGRFLLSTAHNIYCG